ncbi:hypothetical protein CI238_11113 [Colletotrichum incanum]|uniref:Uncharacterized protein n=1 Tax=Colletotrichum incanum TaxID=1573173 RepID=A0A166VXL9_COLIC|nr:hypothetical protein CI238_11113 [Colletotrichum incanum]
MSSCDSDASEAPGAPDTSVWSCIEVHPEDLAAACTPDCTPEKCDNSTVQPHEPPAEPGTPGSFIPFDAPARAPEIRGLAATPLDLFLRFVLRELVNRWAEWTNTVQPSVKGPYKKQLRMNSYLYGVTSRIQHSKILVNSAARSRPYLFISIFYISGPLPNSISAAPYL